MTETQTDTVEVHASQNLLTPLANSMLVSIPLQYYLSVKLESLSQFSNCLRSMKCIENWFVLSCDLETSIKLVKVCEKIMITLEITANM